MRILLVVHEFLPKHRAGTERYTYGLARALGRENEVAVLAGERDAGRKPCTYDDEVLDGIHVRRLFLPDRHHYRETYSNPGLEPAFRSLLSDLRPDVVHFQHLIYLSTSFLEMAAERGIPSVMTLHDYWLMCPMGQLLEMRWESASSSVPEPCDGPNVERCFSCVCPPLRHILRRGVRKRLEDPGELASDMSRLGRVLVRGRRDEVRNMFGPVKARLKGELYVDMDDMRNREEAMRELVKRIRLFISPSSFLRDRFVEWGIPNGKIIHLDNGTETVPFLRFRKEIERKRAAGQRDESGGDLGNGPITLGFVGTIRPHKGPHVLLEALRRIKPPTGIRLRIYGDPGTDPAYSERLRELTGGLDVTFQGRFDEAEKPHIYHEMDALVVPSVWYENSPVTIHEAFAAGTPVIASELGGMGELVKDGKNGMLFEAGNTMALARCIEKFAGDGGLRERLKRGIPRVKNMEEHAEEIMGLYGNLL